MIVQFNESLQIARRPSYLLGWFILLTHGGMLALVPVLTIPLWFSFGIMLGVILSFATALCNHVLICGKRAISSLMWTKSGEWQLLYSDGTISDAQLLPDKFIHLYFVVLNFRISARNYFLSRQAIILVFDSVDPTVFRHLRARLRIARDDLE